MWIEGKLPITRSGLKTNHKITLLKHWMSKLMLITGGSFNYGNIWTPH